MAKRKGENLNGAFFLTPGVPHTSERTIVTSERTIVPRLVIVKRRICCFFPFTTAAFKENILLQRDNGKKCDRPIYKSAPCSNPEKISTIWQSFCSICTKNYQRNVKTFYCKGILARNVTGRYTKMHQKLSRKDFYNLLKLQFFIIVIRPM